MRKFIEGCQISCSDAGPVPDVGMLVAMVIRVEVVPPHVVTSVNVVFVREVPHVDVGEDVFEFWVICERNG